MDTSPGQLVDNEKQMASEGHQPVHKIDPAEERKLLRKLDIRLIPMLTMLYLLSYLDRSNIGNAKIYGLEEDLGMTNTQYSICLCLFFISYILFETPSNVIMKRTRPSVWISFIMVSWGVVMTLMGLVQNFSGLAAARWFLGVTEAGLFPGISFYVTMWYRRQETAFRIAMFFSAASLAGAFSGLLARLIHLMDGVSGQEGWRWIFILEGIATVVLATVAYFGMHDYPQTSSFLTEEEREVVVSRLKEDFNGLSTEYKSKFIWDAFKDWKVYAFANSFLGAVTVIYSIGLFLPTIINQFGYVATKAQLLSVPPFVAGCFMTLIIGYLSMRTKRRYEYMVLGCTTTIVGLIMLIASQSTGVKYAGVHLTACGAFPMSPLIISWGGASMGGDTKRGVAIAIIVSYGTAGGIICSYIYRDQDAPRFILGHAVLIGFVCWEILCATALKIYTVKENRHRDQADGGRVYSAEEKEQYVDEGDNAPFFRFQS